MSHASRAEDETGPAAVHPPARALRLRLVFGPGRILGPGRIDLLDLIERTGSLAAAGRAMKMSYKRAWTIVEELNSTFDAPLVELSRGGSAHGGAVLTPLGREVVTRYRRMLALTLDAVAGDLDALSQRLSPARGDETDEAGPSS